MNEYAAWAPGHITAVFSPARNAHKVSFPKTTNPSDILTAVVRLSRIGSYGAGFSIDRGAKTVVHTSEGNNRKGGFKCPGGINCHLSVNYRDTPITGLKATKLLLRLMLPLTAKQVKSLSLTTELQMPLSQGFGMSAAALVSQALALNQALDMGLEPTDAGRLAHAAEVLSHTGLGDVPAIMVGGVEIRKKPGYPPYGNIKRLDYKDRVVLAVIEDKEIRTKDILTDDSKMKLIEETFKDVQETIDASDPITSLAEASYRQASGIVVCSERTKDALDRLNSHGIPAGEVMLGNTIFFRYTKEALETARDLLPDSAFMEVAGIYTGRL